MVKKENILEEEASIDGVTLKENVDSLTLKEEARMTFSEDASIETRMIFTKEFEENTKLLEILHFKTGRRACICVYSGAEDVKKNDYGARKTKLEVEAMVDDAEELLLQARMKLKQSDEIFYGAERQHDTEKLMIEQECNNQKRISNAKKGKSITWNISVKKTTRKLMWETGGLDVWNHFYGDHYDPTNEWHFDTMPEIMDCINFANFVDCDNERLTIFDDKTRSIKSSDATLTESIKWAITPAENIKVVIANEDDNITDNDNRDRKVLGGLSGEYYHRKSVHLVEINGESGESAVPVRTQMICDNEPDFIGCSNGANDCLGDQDKEN